MTDEHILYPDRLHPNREKHPDRLCSDILFQTNYIWVDHVQIPISKQTMSKQVEKPSLDKLCPNRLCSDKLCSNRLCLTGKQENQSSPTKAYLAKLVRIDQQN